MKGYLALVVFVAGVAGLFYYSMITNKQKWDDLIDQGNKTSGVVANKYKGIEYSYTVDGSSYSRGIRSNPRGLINGEIFTVYYDSEDHSNSVIDLKKPVYDRVDYTTDCVSEIEKIGSGHGGLVNFRYTYKSKEYNRFHKVDFSEIPDFTDYQIVINKQRPEIAYLTYKSCS